MKLKCHLLDFVSSWNKVKGSITDLFFYKSGSEFDAKFELITEPKFGTEVYELNLNMISLLTLN